MKNYSKKQKKNTHLHRVWFIYDFCQKVYSSIVLVTHATPTVKKKSCLIIDLNYMGWFSLLKKYFKTYLKTNVWLYYYNWRKLDKLIFYVRRNRIFLIIRDEKIILYVACIVFLVRLFDAMRYLIAPYGGILIILRKYIWQRKNEILKIDKGTCIKLTRIIYCFLFDFIQLLLLVRCNG